MSIDVDALVDEVRAGGRRALARAITLVENGDPVGEELVRRVYHQTGNATTVGITGAPGTGKSTIVGALVRVLRQRGLTVGVISVDPSSPFTNGALLGDRIRLADHFLDPDVFIRSMGTRGHLGGLAESTLQAMLILDAAGKDVVVVETVGIGQSEIEISAVADTTVLVLAPGAGDSIQALKAGIMEVPDVIAINKADLPGASVLRRAVDGALHLGPPDKPVPKTVLTRALQGEGVDELWEAILAHRQGLDDAGQLAARRSDRLTGEVVALATSRLQALVREQIESDPDLRDLLDQVRAGKVDPLTAVRSIVEEVLQPSPARDGGTLAR